MNAVATLVDDQLDHSLPRTGQDIEKRRLVYEKALQSHPCLKQSDGDGLRREVCDDNWLLNDLVATRLKWWKDHDRSKGGGNHTGDKVKIRKAAEGAKRLQRTRTRK